MSLEFRTLIILLSLCRWAQAEDDRWKDHWETPPPAEECGGGYSYGPDFKLARVIGLRGKKVYFLENSNGCPQAGGPKCRWEKYLIPGDQALVSRKYGSWICGWRVTSEGDEDGWLPIKDLEFIEPDHNPAPEKWVGTWQYNNNVLKISLDKKGQGLRVVGKAIYRSPRGDYWGEIDAVGKSVGTEWKPLDKISAGDCEVRFVLVNDSLVVSDHGICGGPNVRFDGLYQRKKAK